MASSSPSSSSPQRPRPVIVVTGANSGVGFGICQRLLVQLSSPTPSDTLPCHPALVSKRLTTPDAPLDPLPSPFAAPDGCTLVLACRNAIKAHQARAKLQAMLETLHDLPDHVEPPRSAPPPSPQQRARLGQIDEDEDPALLAQAAEASIRRRRLRRDNVAAAEAAAAAAAAGSPASDPQTTTELLLYGDDGVEDDAAPGHDSNDVMRGPGGTPLTPRQREDRARGRYRRRFCRRTRIEFVALDLGSMASALACAKEVTERHGYVTHVILNAGAGAWAGINWLKAAWMMSTGFVNAVTWPKYKLQRSGDIGKDGYGWVWQANVGAHYVLVRALLPALRATPYSTPSRIIWTGSIEAEERFYQVEDPECKDPLVSLASYESTKYQCELAALGLEEVLSSRTRLATQPSTPAIEWDPVTGSATAMSSSGSSDGARKPSPSPAGAFGSLRNREPKSFITHPGVVASSIFAEYLNTILDLLMKLGFYIARWLFSPNHPIVAYKGAIASSHVALAPLPNLDPTIRYGSCTDWFGREYVHLGRVDGWVSHPVKSTLKDLLGLRKKPSERPEAEGRKVMHLARGVVEYCEGVARDVWREAKAGNLPPFSDLDSEFAADAATLLLPSSNRASGAKAQKQQGNVDEAEIKRRRRKDSDTSSWEKVNEAC